MTTAADYLATSTARIADLTAKRSRMAGDLQRMEEEAAMLSATLKVARELVAAWDRTIAREQALHRVLADRVNAGHLAVSPTTWAALTRTTPEPPVLDAEVIDPTRSCPLCPQRGPFKSTQALRLHEQRVHPELVRDRKHEARRTAAAEAAYPRGGGAKR